MRAIPSFVFALFLQIIIMNCKRLIGYAFILAAILGFCYHRLNLFKDAEQQLKSSFKQHPSIFTCLLLAKVYIRMDQPQNAINCYMDGLKEFDNEPGLLAGIARVYEGIGDLSKSVLEYKKLLQIDR